MTRPVTTDLPTQDDLLKADPVFEWIDRHFLRPDPFAFATANFQEFTLKCAAEFDLDPNGIYCIGSGAIGLSLNPGKISKGSLKTFDDESDLDIALISEVHFETGWRNLRERAHPALNEMEGNLVDAMRHQKKRFFDGAIVANRLLPQLDFGPEWIRASLRISEFVAREFGREVAVNFWIYRDYWSVRSYVANGIIRCKERLK